MKSAGQFACKNSQKKLSLETTDKKLLRQIAKTRLFDEQLQQLIEAGAKAADEFIEALEIALARKPEIGWLHSTNPPIWQVPMVDVDRLRPPLLVYYVFDDEHVYLLSVQS
ncbi:MAG: hypothetical protein ACREQX_04610 [Candidatus Binataceae bacterium]